MRTYWKNYFEKTDTLIWVVDATDRERLKDCRDELKGLLVQEVRYSRCHFKVLTVLQRLMGASLLVLKNKSDVPGSMDEDEIREVREGFSASFHDVYILMQAGPPTRPHPDSQMAHHDLQRDNWP